MKLPPVFSRHGAPRLPLVQIVVLVGLCAAPAIPASAQETVNYASVSGRVTDPQGAAVAGAHVTARQTEINIARETVTDAEGRFRFPYLRLGPYEIAVRHAGFADLTRRLDLTVGAAFDLPIPLAIETVAASVTVSGSATILEAARSQIAGTISRVEVANLPLNGRNFLDIALLVPGVSPTNVGGTQLFAETSAVPGVGISIGSQRNFSNNFIVDGLSANDDAAGLSGIPYGVDAVDQFQVVTSGGQAELGRALGGYVNVVTKSGTNLSRGDVYGYFRDDNFNADNALLLRTPGSTVKKLPMTQQQYGGSLGGPIARNRTFFFGNAEQRLLDQSGLATILAENVPVINARLAAAGYPGSPVSTGVYPNPVHSVNVLGKVDHQFSGTDHFSVRYGLYDVNSRNARGAGALNAPSASSGLDNRDQTLAFSNTLTLSPQTVNETRAQFAHADLLALPTDPIGPAVSIAGVASFGTSSGSPTGRLNKMYQVVNNLSHQSGAHALRVGVDFLYNDDTHHLSAVGARRVHVLVARELPHWHVQQRRLHPDVRRERRVADQRQRRPLRAGRMESHPHPHAEWRPALRSAIPEDHRDRHQQRVAASGVRVDAVRVEEHHRARQRRAVLRSRAAAGARQCAAVGREHDRPGQSPADRRQPVAGAGRRAGLSEHPQRRRPNRDARQPDDDEPRNGERVFDAGQPRSRAPARRPQHGERRVSIRAREQPHHLGQSERALVRGVGDEQRVPAQPELRQQQPVFAGGRVQLSRPPRVVRPAAGVRGATTASAIRCRSR